jgi:lipopolysaccharide export system protein LptC
LPEVRNDGRNRHDPDYIISDVRGRKLDTAGNLLYILTADEIRHYPDDDTTDLLKPTLIYLDPKRPPVSIHSVHGHTSSQAERIELWDQVEIHRAATGKDGPLVATMSELTVLTDEERAFHQEQSADHPGTNSWVQGVGMQVNNQLQTYLLESAVTGQIESHFARKKPLT